MIILLARSRLKLNVVLCVVKLLLLQQSLLSEELAPAEVVMALTMVGDPRESVIALPGMSFAKDAASRATIPGNASSARIASSGGTVLESPNIANRERSTRQWASA